MKLRRYKTRFTFYTGIRKSMGVFPTWRVLPPRGWRWVGIELVLRKK